MGAKLLTKLFNDKGKRSLGFLASKIKNLRFNILWDVKPGTSIRNQLDHRVLISHVNS